MMMPVFIVSNWKKGSTSLLFGTLLFQCWGGRHANVSLSERRKNDLSLWEAGTAGKCSESKQRQERDQGIQFGLELGQPSIHCLISGLMLCSWWLQVTETKGNPATFIGKNFFLVAEQRQTQWRCNKGNYWGGGWCWHWCWTISSMIIFGLLQYNYCCGC